jgi:uncharacterized membrane protein YhaH (DUF805 family)
VPVPSSISPRFLIVSVTVLCSLVLAIPAGAPPLSTLGFDAALGMRVWQCMVNGSPFNTLCRPAPQLDLDEGSFYTAQAPGQYLLPGLLTLTGAPVGKVLLIVNLCLLAIGLWGHFKLYSTDFGLGARLALLMALIGAASYQHAGQALRYSGGHALLYCASPYVVMATLRLPQRSLFHCFLYFILLICAFFLKLSFVLLAAGLIVGFGLLLVLPSFGSAKTSLGLLTRVILAVSAAFLLFRWIFLMRGWTAASLSIGTDGSSLLYTLGYSLAAPLSVSFSLFGALNFLGSPLAFVWPSEFHTLGVLSVAALVCIAVAFAGSLIWLLRYRDPRDPEETRLLALLLGVLAVHTFVLTGMLLSRTLHAEDRHYWPVAMLLLPALARAASRSTVPPIVLSLAKLVIVASVLSGGACFALEARRTWKGARAESAWLSFPGIQQPVIDAVLEAERTSGPRSVFFVTNPALAVLLPKSRVRVGYWESPQAFHSSGTEITLVVDEYFLQRHPMCSVFSDFSGVKEWHQHKIGNYFILRNSTFPQSSSASSNCKETQ